MKSKKRHDTSSENSEDSEESLKSASSSESESEDSSVERRHKKKRKHADSSASEESESDDQRKAKKRKHKKKKKKHNKKKRDKRADSEEKSGSNSESDGEGNRRRRKHKHKHKSSKRDRSSSQSEQHFSDGEIDDRRVLSVVKEARASSEGSQPSHTYYQKEYRHTHSGVEYERARELQRFYRDSSKERRLVPPSEPYDHERERGERYGQDRYKVRERYGHNPNYNGSGEGYYNNRRPKEYEEYKRPRPRYEQPHPPGEDYSRRPRDDMHYRESRGGPDGPPRGYNRYEERPRKRDYEDPREYRERRGPEPNRYHGREYPDKRERYREERVSPDRERDVRRERSGIPEKVSSHPPRDYSRSRSPAVHDRERPTARKEPRVERPERNDRRDRERVDRNDRGDRNDREDRNIREEKSDRPRPEQRGPDRGRRDRKTRFNNADEGKDYEWGKTEVKNEKGDPNDKEKPNFGLSGKLTADQNTVDGVVIKYTEPDDAKQPKRRWRFYPFKGDKALPILYIHRQSFFLLGRDKKVADIPLEHPSVSKQHAALQFRATPFTRGDGSTGRRVRPYVIDLDSANGTFVNNKKVEPRRYVELLERDVVKFGFSQREYVLLHENSKDDALDDDNNDQPDQPNQPNQPEQSEIGANVTTTEQIKRDKREKLVANEDGE